MEGELAALPGLPERIVHPLHVVLDPGDVTFLAVPPDLGGRQIHLPVGAALLQEHRDPEILELVGEPEPEEIRVLLNR